MRLGTLPKKAWVPGLGWYKSPRAGRRVKASVTAYLARRLKLPINESKS